MHDFIEFCAKASVIELFLFSLWVTFWTALAAYMVMLPFVRAQ